MASRRRHGLGRAVLYALLFGWTAVCLFPIYWVAVTSLKGPAQIDGAPAYLPFLDFAPVADAWRFVLWDAHEGLILRFLNSAVIGLFSTLIAMLVGAMAVYGLTRFAPVLRWPSVVLGGTALGAAGAGLMVRGTAGAAGLLAAAAVLGTGSFLLRRRGPVLSAFGALGILLSTRILPPVVLVAPVYVMALATGLQDTRLGLVLVYAAINLPVAAWLLYPLFGARRCEQEEAAALDGASHLLIFFTILLPMVRGGLVMIGLLVFLLAWNEYLFAAYLAVDHALTLPPWMAGQLSLKEAQIGGEAEEWAHMSAATLVMAAPALIFAAFCQRIAANALKR